jgi:hypothetical protein
MKLIVLGAVGGTELRSEFVVSPVALLSAGVVVVGGLKESLILFAGEGQRFLLLPWNLFIFLAGLSLIHPCSMQKLKNAISR